MTYLRGSAAWWLPSLGVLVGCSVYDSSLVGTASSSGAGGVLVGGSGGQGRGGFGGMGGTGLGGSSPTSSGGGGIGGRGGSGNTGGSGGAVGCTSPNDCPGMDTDCRTRTCMAMICGTHDTTMGMACTDGGNGQVCDGSGNCVECLDATQCPVSHVCSANDTCAAPTCSDGVQNGDETDVDCGGSCPKKCAFNEHCGVDGDCKGGVCAGGVCVASCTDGVKNGAETDVDCGGGTCPGCGVGQMCSLPTDCSSGVCTGGLCACGGTHLLISEVKSRGAGGGSDEFVELYNPTSADVALDSTWTIEVRSYSSGSYSTKAFTAATFTSHHHYLIGGSAYAGPPAADLTGLPGIKDAASVVLKHAGAVVDAVCFSYNSTTHDAIANGTGYVCEGNLVSNLPHNDAATGQSDTDVSIERKPGGAAGNCVDTDDNASDFNSDVPSTPQDLASPPT